MFDGIDLCSNGETAKSNTIYNSTIAGVNMQSAACGGTSATDATVTGNTINEACAGILTRHRQQQRYDNSKHVFQCFHRGGGRRHMHSTSSAW